MTSLLRRLLPLSLYKRYALWRVDWAILQIAVSLWTLRVAVDRANDSLRKLSVAMRRSIGEIK